MFDLFARFGSKARAAQSEKKVEAQTNVGGLFAPKIKNSERRTKPDPELRIVPERSEQSESHTVRCGTWVPAFELALSRFATEAPSPKTF